MLNDFHERSDIDVIAVSAKSPSRGVKEKLAREPTQQVVKDALDIRLGKYNQKLDRISVERFLDAAEAAFVMPDITIKPMPNK